MDKFRTNCAMSDIAVNKVLVDLDFAGSMTLVIPALTTLQSQLEEDCRRFGFSVVNLNKVKFRVTYQGCQSYRFYMPRFSA